MIRLVVVMTVAVTLMMVMGRLRVRIRVQVMMTVIMTMMKRWRRVDDEQQQHPMDRSLIHHQLMAH
jgi:hypothetical protein